MNWWLATLEHFGLITREEADHIADNIKNSIHKEGYQEAYDELETILRKIKVPTKSVISGMEAEIAELRADLAKLKEDFTKPSTPAYTIVSSTAEHKVRAGAIGVPLDMKTIAKPIATAKKA